MRIDGSDVLAHPWINAVYAINSKNCHMLIVDIAARLRETKLEYMQRSGLNRIYIRREEEENGRSLTNLSGPGIDWLSSLTFLYDKNNYRHSN